VNSLCEVHMEAAAWFFVWSFVAPSYLVEKKQHQSGGGSGSRDSSDEEKEMKTSRKNRVFGVDREIDIPPEVFPTSEEFEELEGEAIMPGCQHGWYDSVYGGAKLHYRKFLPAASGKSTRAVLVYQHGIATHGGKAMVCRDGRRLNMSLMSGELVKEGIALYAPDMYGHGYSEGTRFWIPDTWENNLKDLMNFVDLVVREHPGIPLFLMGESYGGTLAIHAGRRYQDDPTLLPNLAGVLLTGPAIDADLPPYPVYYLLKNVLAPRWPKWRPFFMPNPVSPERIWRDPEVLEARTAGRFVESGVDGSGIPFRLGTAANMVTALEEVRSNAIPGFELPYCIVHGTEDAGVPISGSDYMWATASTPESDREYHRIDGAYHDMLSDPAAEETVGYFVGFIKKRVAGCAR